MVYYKLLPKIIFEVPQDGKRDRLILPDPKIAAAEQMLRLQNFLFLSTKQKKKYK